MPNVQGVNPVGRDKGGCSSVARIGGSSRPGLEVSWDEESSMRRRSGSNSQPEQVAVRRKRHYVAQGGRTRQHGTVGRKAQCCQAGLHGAVGRTDIRWGTSSRGAWEQAQAKGARTGVSAGSRGALGHGCG